MAEKSNKIPLIIFFIIFKSFLLFGCGSEVKRAEDKKRDECLRLVGLYQLQEQTKATANSANLTPSQQAALNASFSYTCSADSNAKPGCIEFYFIQAKQKAETSFCASGYNKRTAKCSSQNNVGTCRLLLDTGYQLNVYSKPNDTEEEAQMDCSLRSGTYTTKEGDNLLPTIIFSCDLG